MLAMPWAPEFPLAASGVNRTSPDGTGLPSNFTSPETRYRAGPASPVQPAMASNRPIINQYRMPRHLPDKCICHKRLITRHRLAAPPAGQWEQNQVEVDVFV